MAHIGTEGMHTRDPLRLKVVHDDLLSGATAVTVDIGRERRRDQIA
jgi:hypothetical protein